MAGEAGTWPGGSLDRGDLHNCNIDESAAGTDRCGTADLRTGRVCLRPARHRGPCGFDVRPGQSTHTAADRA